MGLTPPGIPRWLQRFDWLVGWSYGWADTTQFPRSVFCHPNSLDGLLLYLEGHFGSPLPETGANSLLVVGGEDTLLSQQRPRTLSRLQSYFGEIFYEAYDVDMAGVDIMPIGLTEFYLRGHEDRVFEAMGKREQKDGLLLSAFGKFWPGLNETLDDRRKAAEFSQDCTFATLGPFSQNDYFNALARHSFMICPRGNGVQAPKLTEAFLTCCTPIVTASPMARALEEKGAPLLIVNNWGEVTEPLLESQREHCFARARSFFDVVSDLDRWWDFSFNHAKS
ncbi:MAG: hypothetical protein AAF553_02845 [Pseudomonadota bacterium]